MYAYFRSYLDWLINRIWIFPCFCHNCHKFLKNFVYLEQESWILIQLSVSSWKRHPYSARCLSDVFLAFSVIILQLWNIYYHTDALLMCYFQNIRHCSVSTVLLFQLQSSAIFSSQCMYEHSLFIFIFPNILRGICDSGFSF